MNIAVAPFDIDKLAALSACEQLAWPVNPAVVRAMLRDRIQACLQLISQMPKGDGRWTTILALGQISSRYNWLSEVALTVQYAERQSIKIRGLGELGCYFQDADGATAMPDLTPIVIKDMAPLRWLKLRKWKNTGSWTNPVKLLTAMLAPDGIAVSKNSLLVAEMKRTGKLFRFEPASELFSHLVAQERKPLVDVCPLVEAAASCLSEIAELTPIGRDRLKRLLIPALEAELTIAGNDLAALGTWDNAPERMASGTGGWYPARALGIEVLRRGGEVCRFDHGGRAGAIDENDRYALGELLASSKLVVPTKAAADAISRENIFEYVPDDHPITLGAGNGDPLFRSIKRNCPIHQSRARPKVLYVTTILKGPRQFMLPLLPDAIYLNWQQRIIQKLQSLPIDLYFRPHPEGILAGRTHPFADTVEVLGGPFEDLLAEADVLLFDFGQTTSIWSASCSDRPIVYLDLDLSPMTSFGKKFFERRCRIVKATYDANNLPQIDDQELADAILGAPARTDPSEARELLAGD